MRKSANVPAMLLLLAFISCPLTAVAQALNAQQMQQALNSYDRPGLFAQPGASNPVQNSYPPQQAAPTGQFGYGIPSSSQQGEYNYSTPQQFNYPQQQQYSYTPQTQAPPQYSYSPQPGAPQQYSQPQYSSAQQTQPTYGYGLPARSLGYPQAGVQAQQAPVSPLRALFAGQSKPATPAPKSVSPLQYVMQQFLGGSATSTTSGGGSGNDQQKLYNAREYLQTANDQASRAYNAAQRANYGSDKYARKSAATEAYYAAQAARYAANNATAAAAGGSSAANDAAAQARNAADRAQASADQASSNANNGGGW